MTDRIDALKALDAKIAAGDWNPYQTHWPAGDGVEGYVERAYNGSLDAALALHASVLPGWTFNVWDDGAEVSNASHRNDQYFIEAKDTPARAWLLTIIRALIALENEDD